MKQRVSKATHLIQRLRVHHGHFLLAYRTLTSDVLSVRPSRLRGMRHPCRFCTVLYGCLRRPLSGLFQCPFSNLLSPPRPSVGISLGSLYRRFRFERMIFRSDRWLHSVRISVVSSELGSTWFWSLDPQSLKTRPCRVRGHMCFPSLSVADFGCPVIPRLAGTWVHYVGLDILFVGIELFR